jgi:hypothetical protein
MTTNPTAPQNPPTEQDIKAAVEAMLRDAATAPLTLDQPAKAVPPPVSGL